jgi:hypothetical protein
MAASQLAFTQPISGALTTKKWTVFDVLKPWSKKPRQNFLTWQKLKRQKS